MSDESVATTDDQSHYEISLTAGQAFIAFVLLLLSLAASFAFGLMIGKGQGDERLVVRKEPSIVTEASAIPKKTAGKIVELGVADDDFKKTDTTASTATTSTGGQAHSPVQPAPTPEPTPVSTITEGQAGAPVLPGHLAPTLAGLPPTFHQKTAQDLAAELTTGGFT